MKYCMKCKVYVGGKNGWCPLCQNRLAEKEAAGADIYPGCVPGRIFPKIPDTAGIYSLCIRILLLLSVIAAVISVAVNYFIRSAGWWSLLVVAALVCLWLLAGMTIRKRKNILKNILWQMVMLSVICVIWDAMTKWRGWSVDFVLPILYSSAMIVLFVIQKVLRLKAEDYLVYGLMGGIFGLLPLIFLLTGLISHALPSVLCIAISVLFLAVLFIFQGGQMISELRRRSHW